MTRRHPARKTGATINVLLNFNGEEGDGWSPLIGVLLFRSGIRYRARIAIGLEQM